MADNSRGKSRSKAPARGTAAKRKATIRKVVAKTSVRPAAPPRRREVVREVVEEQRYEEIARDILPETVIHEEVVIERAPAPEVKPSPRRRSVPSVSALTSTVTTRATRGVRRRDITAFLRQLIMMLEAGTPLLKALKTLQHRGEHKGIRNMVAGMAEYVEAGNPLWQAFAREPRYFSPVDVNLIKASEASGTLVVVLERMVDYRERRELLQKRIAAAMIYPVVLIIAVILVIVVISALVIPAFVEMFESAGIELQGYTKGFIATTNFIVSWWWLLILIPAVLAVVYFGWWVRSPSRKIHTDRLKLKTPILGPILRKSAIVDFCRTFALMLRSGLSMIVTLDLCRNAMSNRAYADAIQDMRESVERGEGLERPLREAERRGLFPGVVVDMLITGEETGTMDRIADQIADRYDEEVKIEVGTLGDVLVPILTVIIGVFVVLLALAVFSPLIQMIENLSSGAGV